MNKTIWILFSFVPSLVWGSTITGNLQTITGSVYNDNNIVFQPQSTPWANGINNTVMDISHRVATSNGLFTVTLLGGAYQTFFTGSKPIWIFVPVNDTNTYTFNQVATNVLTLALLNTNYYTIPAPFGIATLTNNLVAPASVSVTASPFSYTNNDGYSEFVFINGGTSSVLSVNGTAVFATVTNATVTLPLQPNEFVTITYSSAPTMRKKPY